MRAIAYVDGFNFYYGLTKGTRYRWCDLFSLCQHISPPGYELQLVRLFCGRSKALTDSKQPERQQAYLRALETTNKVCVERSNFSVRPKEYYLEYCPIKVKVRVPREKGSDVNLATFLLVDAYHNKYDLAMVLSNDSDLENPVKAVRKEFKKQVRIYFPVKSKEQQLSDKLIRAAAQASHEIIPLELVEKYQLPERITRVGKKDIVKPREWYTSK